MDTRPASRRQGRPRAAATAAVLAAACALVLVPFAGGAGGTAPTAFVPTKLIEAARANPNAVFKVIVQGKPGRNSADVADDVRAERASNPGGGRGLKRRFASISGVSAELTGRQVAKLATRKWILAITDDVPLVASDAGPVAAVPPLVSGTPTDGGSLTATSGTWTGADPIAYAYQWQRCDATGLACADVDGAAAATYAPGAADVGSTLRVVVTATDALGSGTSESLPTAVVAVAAPISVTAPAIAGTPEVGQVLTASTGEWSGTAPLVYAYQWRRCDAGGLACTDLLGATAAAYVPVAADVDSTLRVAVAAANAGGSVEAVSTATAAVADTPAPAPPPPPPPVAPSAGADPEVTGAAEDGSTLTASAGDWTGTAPIDVAYQWHRCGPASRTAAALAGGPLGYWPLDETTGTTAADASGNGLPGTYQTAPGGTVVVPGVANASFASQFTLEAWVDVASPQLNSGIVGKWRHADGGGILLWIDDNGYYSLAIGRVPSEYLTSTAAPTPGVRQHVVGTFDGTTMRLYVDGAEVAERTFGGSVGNPTTELAIGDYDGSGHVLDGSVTGVGLYGRALSPAEVGARHLGCTAIPGATGATYAATADDVGSRLRVAVTATNAAGQASVASAPTAVVAAALPAETTPPAIAGRAEDGETLAATAGTWSGTDPIETSYQWQRCDAAGGSCEDLAGATSATYALGTDDVGSTVRVVVSAANAAGTATAPSGATAAVASGIGTSSGQQWPYATGVAAFWAEGRPQPPTIAFVDSGIDAARADFGGRVVQQVVMTSRTPNSAGDGLGHGTFVAGIAAGQARGYTGAAPQAGIVSIDVMDDTGVAQTSDVIAAADWIYQNKDVHNIRVANFSLQGSAQSSLRVDPVDKAVEKLWHSGVVVVAAAGNYAVDGQDSGVLYAPGNDPFIITVGATDLNGTVAPSDDFAAPWSAYGHTLDGFAKPELGAPGRYLVGPVPPDATLALERPDRIVAPGYMQLSGTSFAAPVVAGAAADLLAGHPGWTPSHVKGALMLTAAQTADTSPLAVGAGALDAAAADAVAEPPNPNEALEAFLVPDPQGGPTPVFDGAAWATTVEGDTSWGSAYWASAYWASAYWASAYWASAYWASAYWASGSSSLSSPDAYWASQSEAAQTNGAADDHRAAGGYLVSAADRAAAELRLTPHP